jgi:hypothetical protein
MLTVSPLVITRIIIIRVVRYAERNGDLRNRLFIIKLLRRVIK